jgi:hypothetical protein
LIEHHKKISVISIMLNATNRAALKYIIVLYIAITLLMFFNTEKYRPDYRYGFVDTNPARRVSGAFDACSPENMEDCKLSNPYEGLPLP